MSPEYIDDSASNELGFSKGSYRPDIDSLRERRGNFAKVARGLSRAYSSKKVKISGLQVELHAGYTSCLGNRFHMETVRRARLIRSGRDAEVEILVFAPRPKNAKCLEALGVN